MRAFLLILLVGATLLKVAATEEAKVAATEEKVEEKKEQEVQEIIVEVERPTREYKKKEKEEVEQEAGPIERDEDGEVPVIMTSTGKVSGIRERSTEGKAFFSYYSIPYAKPPVGELRFKDPQLLSGWGGVRDGSTPPPPCPQMLSTDTLTGKQEIQGDEDCLYLNIFTPKAKDSRPHLPVMVYIHGGGFVCGSTSEYPPYPLLNEDVVIVTLQYRLGILGFLSTEDDVITGNMGLKDQTLALSWIQRNVHKFGGDPLSITLFGESAGAASVHFQILTPKSIGMFKRAILHSGSALCPWAMGAKHAAVAEYAGVVFNCTIDEGSEKLIECLQGVDALKLAGIPQHLTEWLFFPLLMGPRVDGQYLPKHPNFLMKEGRHKRVDLMTGITRDEGALFSLSTWVSWRGLAGQWAIF
ncbi:Venom carboxylesterase-6 [Portunus trituberculatus]|uniref:Carboxylic ester hydrolase n=1 Tax=Portunus trituberculatus TaxID=210409 RepID=A0A5B7DUV5_PORTR|nr:Venom carboxylesterase-6 [Portunus trituberculatus]